MCLMIKRQIASELRISLFFRYHVLLQHLTTIFVLNIFNCAWNLYKFSVHFQQTNYWSLLVAAMWKPNKRWIVYMTVSYYNKIWHMLAFRTGIYPRYFKLRFNYKKWIVNTEIQFITKRWPFELIFSKSIYK